MKTILFFAILILLYSNTFAQENWPPIGAKWYYSYQYFNISELGPLEYIYFEAEKDTFLNDTTCRKIHAEYQKQSGQVMNLGYEYIFSTEDSVFNYHDGHFYLLYDFSRHVGDTIKLFLGSNSDLYRQISNVTLNKDYLKHVVTARDSIEIGGRKYLEITLNYCYDELGFNLLIFNQSQIIKGIGSSSFLTGEWFSGIESDIYGPLRCYSDSDLNYTSNIPCDTIIMDIKQDKTEKRPILFPNPIDNESILSFPNYENYETNVVIVNSMGKIIHNAITTLDYISINPVDYASGIYYYWIIIDKRLIGSGKFLKMQIGF
jgi:hypothetical protein